MFTSEVKTRRFSRVVIAAAIAAAMAIVVSCVPPDEGGGGPGTPSHQLNLRAHLIDGGFNVTWDISTTGVENGYELQAISNKAEHLGWQNIPVDLPGEATMLGATPRARYNFRIREVAPAGEPLRSWSSPVSWVYVEPVLPVIRIDTDNAAPILDRENYVNADFAFEPNGSDYPAVNSRLEIRGRGNSTWAQSKKPYRLKLESRHGLMGIAPNRHWALLANALDESQLRSYAASQITQTTDLDWNPQYRHVEVIMNGEYLGVYNLVEHSRIEKVRIDIEEMDEDDNEGEAVTGGYRIEIDFRLEENNEPGFRTNRNVPIVIKDPDPATPQQMSYIKNYIQQFENAIFSPNFANETGGYRDYVHVDSLIDSYLVQELTKQQDAFSSSTFFTKERSDDKFKFGPLWDFDLSQGSGHQAAFVDRSSEGWFVRGRGQWLPRIFTDSTFVAEFNERWEELSPELHEIPARVQALGEDLQPAIQNNMARWYKTSTLSWDTPEFVAGWLQGRIDWIDNQVANAAD